MVRSLADRTFQLRSESSGNILEDAELLSTLERIKKQAAELALESEGMEKVMQEIEETSLQYLPTAGQMATSYFALESFSCLSVLYRYSISFFMGIFDTALHPESHANLDPDAFDKRLVEISKAFFRLLFEKVQRGIYDPGRSAHFERLVLGCIKVDFCK